MLRNVFKNYPGLGLSLRVRGYIKAYLSLFFHLFIHSFIHLPVFSSNSFSPYLQTDERKDRVRSIRRRKRSNYKLSLYSFHLNDYIFYLILCHLGDKAHFTDWHSSKSLSLFLWQLDFFFKVRGRRGSWQENTAEKWFFFPSLMVVGKGLIVGNPSVNPV